MKKFFILVVFLAGFYACHHEYRYGYLKTDNIEYYPDSLEVVANTNCNDIIHTKYGVPWASVPIQGVAGTPPIFFSIKSISSENGEGEKMKKYLKIRGDGVFYLYPFDTYNDIPVGEYRISIIIENDNDRREFDNVFKIIVKQ